jgi:hypothetical protein
MFRMLFFALYRASELQASFNEEAWTYGTVPLNLGPSTSTYDKMM